MAGSTYVHILSASLLLVALQHFGKLFYVMNGLSNRVLPHYPGPCKHVEGLRHGGSEDMTLLSSGIVLITSALHIDDKKKAVGSIYALDLSANGPATEVKVLGWPSRRRFLPHGIGHWVDDSGAVLVFVVLHQPESIGRFLYDGQALTLTKLYENSTLLHSLNSIHPTGPDSFYVTNFQGSSFGHRWSQLTEMLLWLPLGDVVYVSDTQTTKAATSLMHSNGLTGDNRYVYVAVKDAIKVFSRAADNQLILYKSIPSLTGSNDNLKLDADGNLWIGSQMTLLETAMHLGDNTVPCPSQIIRIRNPEREAIPEAVFTDDGQFLSCVSGGIYYKGRLLIGTIADRLAICDVRYLA